MGPFSNRLQGDWAVFFIGHALNGMGFLMGPFMESPSVNRSFFVWVLLWMGPSVSLRWVLLLWVLE